MEIELLTTQALINELITRFDHVIIAGIKDSDRQSMQEIRNYRGDYRLCQGLASGMIIAIERDRDKIIEDLSEDDM